MNGLPYYKKFPRSFLDGTVGMTLEQKGAYAIVLDLIYMTDGRLKDDARYIAGQLGCSLRKWSVIRSDLLQAGKLTLENGIISNSRADNLLETTRKFLDKQRENGGKAKKNSTLMEPSLTPSPPIREKREETNTSDEVFVSEPSVPRQIVKIRCEEFDEVWRLWPQKGRSAKSKALVLWKAKGSTAEPVAMLAAVRRYLASPDAKKDAGAYVPALERWVRDRLESWLEVGVALNTPTSMDFRLKIFADTQIWDEAWGDRPEILEQLPLLEAAR